MRVRIFLSLLFLFLFCDFSFGENGYPNNGIDEGIKDKKGSVAYCGPIGMIPYNDHITGLTLGTINNNPQANPTSTTTNGIDGYGDYTSLSTDLSAGSTNNAFTSSVILAWGNSSATSPAYLYAWIDFNGDQDFDDPGEMVIAESVVLTDPGYTGPISGTISVPANANLGPTRMRVIVKNISSTDPAADIPPTSCESSFIGEVEDYTINVVAASTDTDPPIPTLTGPATTSGTYDVNIAFNETVTASVLAADFTVLNGSVSSVSSLINGTSIVATIQPTVPGDVEVTLNANAVADLAGNLNLVSNTHICNYFVAPLTLNLSPSPESAVGANDGAIAVSTNGGALPYTYDWAHIAGSNDPSDLTGLSSGTYSLTVTDNLGTTASANATVNVAGPTGSLIDLSISMFVDDYSADAFENRTYTIKVRNDKWDIADNVKLLIPIISTDFVVQGANPPEASAGSFDELTGIWDVGAVPFGTTHTLKLHLFTKIAEPTLYAQVNEIDAANSDIDSTPGNGVSPNVVEDDEAKVVLGVEPVFPANRTRFVKLKKKLDASYTAVTDYVLRFTYEEEYHVRNMIDDVLEYQIYTSSYEPISNMSGILPNKYGVNWHELDLSSILGTVPGQATILVLEVKNLNKEETYFLRFKYISG